MASMSAFDSNDFATRCMASACKSDNKAKGTPIQVQIAYGVFASVSLLVYHFVAGGEFSAVMTMSLFAQCLAMLLLTIQARSSGSSAGISARALTMEALALGCRLSSTLWLQGYLPVDESGDWVFQAVDLCTLAIVVALLRTVLVEQRTSYNAEEDSLPVVPLVLGSLVLAALLHADLNSRPLFDALWMAGLFIGVLAVLPQLWLISRTGGRVEALTSHFIAMMALGRLLSGSFMWAARHEIACRPWIGEFQHAIWAILAAHLIHFLLLGDFAYYYLKAVAKSGLSACVQVPVSDMV